MKQFKCVEGTREFVDIFPSESSVIWMMISKVVMQRSEIVSKTIVPISRKLSISILLLFLEREYSKPLILYDDPTRKSYSQAHVRLYAAMYDTNGVLCAETLHPPLRDTKKFEQIQLIKIVQSSTELHSGETAFIYCTYDAEKLKSDTSHYIVQFAFVPKNDRPDPNRLYELFETQSIDTPALYVHKCTVSIKRIKR